MALENLTRAEAMQRSALIATRTYHVAFDLTGHLPDGSDVPHPTQLFAVTSSVSFTSGAGDTHLDVIADQILSADIDGEPLALDGFNGYRLPLTVSSGDHVLTVTALHRFSRTGEGLHRFVDPLDDRPYLYTQHEAADARRTFACFDQPDMKARYTFSVTAPERWTVISNSPTPPPTSIGDGRARWDFAETPPMSTYITALVAGEFHSIRKAHQGRGGEVVLGLHCRQSLVKFLDADRLFRITESGFGIFEQHFGTPYPFADYDQVFVPEFNAGAMENAGCVTIRDEYLPRSRVTDAMYDTRDSTILHELAHMWFGDLVTMKWWDDLWLNESFAEWASYFAQREDRQGKGIDPWASFAAARKLWAYEQDQMPTTHPIAADMVDLDAVENNFDGITYAKGASALQQLVAWVGQDAFLAGVRSYFAEHAWGNTQLADLLRHLTAASGRDLEHFSGQWLEQAGVNTLRADFDVDDDGRFKRFAVLQTADPRWPTLRQHRLAIGLYEVNDGRLQLTDRVETDIAGDATDIGELAGKKRPDLILLNDRDLTYAKIRLDPVSLATAINCIDQTTDDLARALLWGATWDMCRDGEMAAADFVTLGLRGLRNEPDLGVVQAVLGRMRTAADYFAPRADRSDLRALLTGGLAALLRDADPGSDHQLAYAQSLMTTSDSSAGIELVRGWLAGEEVPAGLAVDTDLRWRIVHELARQGADDGLIAAELELDSSVAGQEAAAAARSARPDPESKAWAWKQATASDELSNEAHDKVCANFWQFDQGGALLPYRERYLEVVDAIAKGEAGWAGRGMTMRQHVVKLLFPLPFADQGFVAGLDAWMHVRDLPEAIKRPLVEKRDFAVRALRAQGAWQE